MDQMLGKMAGIHSIAKMSFSKNKKEWKEKNKSYK